MIENVNVGLAFVWDSGRQILKSYVDGFLYDSISHPTSRTYWSLNFNPIKYVESIAPHVRNSVKSSMINAAFFKNVTFDPMEPLLRGSLDIYFVGCFSPIDASLMTPVKLSVSDEYAALSDIDQCKITCIGLTSQIFLVDPSSKCYCVKNSKTLSQRFSSGSCASDPTLFKAYTATNLNFDRLNITDLNLNVTKILKNDQIEIDDPIGFKIVSTNGAQNFRTYVEFGDGIVKTAVGNCFLFNQYAKAGTYQVKITSVPINSNTIKNNRTSLFDLTVLGKVDKQPMFSAQMDISSRTVIDSKWNVNVSVIVSGGAPYTCQISFGDATSTKLDLSQRLNKFYINHVYDYTGIYNITLICTSKTVSDSAVQDWKIAFLPYKNKNADYSLLSNAYSLANFVHVFKARNSSDKAEYSLELPFQMASANLAFLVDDLIANKNAVYQWVSTDQSLKTTGKNAYMFCICP